MLVCALAFCYGTVTKSRHPLPPTRTDQQIALKDIGLALSTTEVSVRADQFDPMGGRMRSAVLVILSVCVAASLIWPFFLYPHLSLVELGLLNGAYLGLSFLAGGIVIACWRVPAIFRATTDPAELRTRWMMGAVLATGVTLPLFQVFKQIVLPARGFPLDVHIVAAEHWIFGGRDAWEVTHALFGGLWPTLVLDTAYAVWLPMMFLFPMVVSAAIHDTEARGRLIGTWVASWVIIGSIGAWLLGSAGPCYYNDLVGPNAGFLKLHVALQGLDAQAQAVGLSIRALYFQHMLEATQAGSNLDFASGISAMPSMHVAMASLFAIAGFRRSTLLGSIFTVYALMIWIASVHLGWHYALDGVVGAAMMGVLWGLSKPIARILAR